MRIRKLGWSAVTVVIAAGVLLAYFRINNNCCSSQISSAKLSSLHKQAQSGDAGAMLELFFYYDEKNEEAVAQRWLERAADAGNSDAAMFLYRRLAHSSDPARRSVALKYLQAAAEQGSPSAQELLGKLYVEGSGGLPRNAERAKYWFRRSALAGDPDGVLRLCNVALSEKDRPQCMECLSLLTRAAERVKRDSYLGRELSLLHERLDRELQK